MRLNSESTVRCRSLVVAVVFSLTGAFTACSSGEAPSAPEPVDAGNDARAQNGTFDGGRDTRGLSDASGTRDAAVDAWRDSGEAASDYSWEEGIGDADSAPARGVPRGCGDGRIGGFEECDDANDVETDGCLSTCRVASCGDGVTQNAAVATVVAFTFESAEQLHDFYWPALSIGKVHGEENHALVARPIDISDSTILTIGNFPRGPEQTGSFRFAIHAREPRRLDFLADRGGDVPNEVLHTSTTVGVWQRVTFEVPAEGWVRFEWRAELELGEELWVDDIVIRQSTPAEECDGGRWGDRASCLADCTRPACGNGVLEPGEVCDDGNYVLDDGCRAGCVPPRCGDAIVDPGEECDDGNTEDDDECLTTCVASDCGDGVIETGVEECDNGTLNLDAPNHCSVTCEVPFCGNGIIDYGEECDDGNDDEDDGCRTTCRRPACGDGLLDEGEACDDGNTSERDRCTSLCAPPRCGDGLLSTGERCDLGDASIASGCSTPCPLGGCGDGETNAMPFTWTIHSPGVNVYGTEQAIGGGAEDTLCLCGEPCGINDPYAPEHGVCQTLGHFRAVAARYTDPAGVLVRLSDWECGDAGCVFQAEATPRVSLLPILTELVCEGQRAEECDDGTNDGGPGLCRPDCTEPRCGDGIVDPSEQCDPGAAVQEASCTIDCTFAQCGDAVVDGDEPCDDGVNNSNTRPNVCRIGCVLPKCGDGVVDDGEDCDDGNLDDEDACPNNCVLGFCGDGVVNHNEECDEGSDEWQRSDDWGIDGCYPDCTASRCGDWVLDPNEACERHDVGCTCQCSIASDRWTFDCGGRRLEPQERDDTRCGNGFQEWWEECDPARAGQVGCAEDCTLDVCGTSSDGSVTGVAERVWPMTACNEHDTLAGGRFGFGFDAESRSGYRDLRTSEFVQETELVHFVGVAGTFELSFEYRTRNAATERFQVEAGDDTRALPASDAWQTLSYPVTFPRGIDSERAVIFTAIEFDRENVAELHLRNVRVVEAAEQPLCD